MTCGEIRTAVWKLQVMRINHLHLIIALTYTMFVICCSIARTRCKRQKLLTETSRRFCWLRAQRWLVRSRGIAASSSRRWSNCGWRPETAAMTTVVHRAFFAHLRRLRRQCDVKRPWLGWIGPGEPLSETVSRPHAMMSPPSVARCLTPLSLPPRQRYVENVNLRCE